MIISISEIDNWHYELIPGIGNWLTVFLGNSGNFLGKILFINFRDIGKTGYQFRKYQFIDFSNTGYWFFYTSYRFQSVCNKDMYNLYVCMYSMLEIRMIYFRNTNYWFRKCQLSPSEIPVKVHFQKFAQVWKQNLPTLVLYLNLLYATKRPNNII